MQPPATAVPCRKAVASSRQHATCMHAQNKRRARLLTRPHGACTKSHVATPRKRAGHPRPPRTIQDGRVGLRAFSKACVRGTCATCVFADEEKSSANSPCNAPEQTISPQKVRQALGASVRCKTPSEPWWMIASCCSRRLQHLHHVGAIGNGPCAAQSSAWTVGSLRAFVVRHRRRCLSLL